ncbi:hypothetical protein LIER_40996 [Lithospermum erythrorhizon]|uniref:Uncharacterized protein n=1 Tax=Lithospermum erythrorhizon TaxID=34254 RepID=A0AAV3R4Z3_LITER
MVKSKQEGGLGVNGLREWNKMLKCKEEIKRHIVVRVRNGKEEKFMSDQWHHRGRLIEVLSAEAVRPSELI